MRSLMGLCAVALVGCGTKEPTKADPTASPPSLSQNLSKEIAEPFVSKEASGPALCAWSVQKYSDTTWIFLSFDKAQIACADALQSAGLVTVGKCVDEASGGKCFKREISATGKLDSKMHEKTNELGFACGTLEFKGITSITTKDASATVRYKRTLTFNAELMKTLEPCVLQKPEAGELERERKFQRDDTGQWSMLK